MAGRRSNGNSATAAKPKRTLTRKYVVVRVDGPDKFTVLDPGLEAKSGRAARDAVAHRLAPEQRNVELGSFLEGSYGQTRYTSEQTWETKSEDRPPAFERPVPSGAARTDP